MKRFSLVHLDLYEFNKETDSKTNDLTLIDECNYNLFDLNQIHHNIINDIQTFDDIQEASSSVFVKKPNQVLKASSSNILPGNRKQRKRSKMTFLSPDPKEEIEISQIVINDLLDCNRMISSEVIIIVFISVFLNLN